MKKIYLDHSATTPVDKKVMQAMAPYFSDVFGNASSIHSFGQAALKGIDKARQRIAEFLNCEPGEIIFTSGATESDNLAVKGVIKALTSKGMKTGETHVITSLVEHDAVLEPFMELEKKGFSVSHVPVLENGVIDIEKLKAKITDKTVLVSIMWVNSEIGSIMPIREIGKIVKKIREKREREWKKLNKTGRSDKPVPIYFHTDATQALNFIQCDVGRNYIDLLSFSGHKIYGPKGVGALYRREGVPLEALQRGGHQEKNFRSGTYNTTGIVGLGAAVARLDKESQDKNNKYIAGLRDKLVVGIKKNIPDTIFNTDRDNSTRSHAHFSFIGAEGEALLMRLDMEGIAVSTGSACASGSLKASHVLIAMGIDKEVSHYSIRFTLGKHNTEDEIKTVVKKLALIVKNLRQMNPVYG
ncbi:cysteine desulfurase [Candidatus Parcubacteria bacterium]|nr:cysteine desulfurase [Candidatus Parcubacteria bacterium]